MSQPEPQSQKPSNEEEEIAPTPFDNPFFLPVVLVGMTLWLGYDGFLNQEFIASHTGDEAWVVGFNLPFGPMHGFPGGAGGGPGWAGGWPGGSQGGGGLVTTFLSSARAHCHEATRAGQRRQLDVCGNEKVDTPLLDADMTSLADCRWWEGGGIA